MVLIRLSHEKAEGVGVSAKAILQALRSPTAIELQAKGVLKYIGPTATVVLNEIGKLITAWGQPRVQ